MGLRGTICATACTGLSFRLKYEEALFSNFGGVSRAARSMRPSGKVSAFMNQNPRKVAAFVSLECLDYRRFEASDLLPYATRETLEELGLVGYQIDTFLSDYDDFIDERVWHGV